MELLFRFNSWVACGEVENFDWIGSREVEVGRIDIVGRQLDLGLVGVEVHLVPRVDARLSTVVPLRKNL